MPNKLITLANLTTYDTALKEWSQSASTNSIKTVLFDSTENAINFYKKPSATSSDTADFSIELPESSPIESGSVVGVLYSNSKLYDPTDFTPAYIVGATPLASDWLSLTEGGDPITPTEDGTVYKVQTEGEYVEKFYVWSDTASEYVEVLGKDVTAQIKGAGQTASPEDAGKYLKIIIANETHDVLWILVNELVDVVTTDNQGTEVILSIDVNNNMTASAGKIPATKSIYSEAAAAVYTQVESGSTFDPEVIYYTKSGDEYTEDDTVDADNFDTKVAAGLYVQTSPAIAEVTVKAKLDELDYVVATTADINNLFD